ncbi:conserved Plasmodium protein, unknown function [Plasmodium malariae]|uniref:Uncharacterized protein n=1 Tax=Plasmodium malariae TaxID=5858 RepID=A0A1C3KL08_PLAMA|nr:conserved Plasmodium protein, unknown function [Plasmodium malariae]
MENIREEVRYLISEVHDFCEEDLFNILCLNNILFYLYDIFTHIDLIYLICFFQLCTKYNDYFCCVNIKKITYQLNVLLNVHTKLCINTFENLKNENISKCTYIYINLLILSLFEYNLFFVFKFISFYCLINPSELLKLLPSLLFIYNMSYENHSIDINGDFKIRKCLNIPCDQRNVYYMFVIRSLILHVLSKIGCSDNNIPIIYNCIYILLSEGSSKMKKGEPSTDDSRRGSGYLIVCGNVKVNANVSADVHVKDGLIRPYNVDENNIIDTDFSYDGMFNTLYLLYFYDKLIDSNENIMSKYFKYVEKSTLHIQQGTDDDDQCNYAASSNRMNNNVNDDYNKDNINNTKTNYNEKLVNCLEEDINIFCDLKNVLILLKISRYYNVSNYINSIIKLINIYFRKYKNQVIYNNFYNKIQNSIIKISILILIVLSMNKYVEFEIIYNLLKKNFLKNKNYNEFNTYSTNIISSVIIFTRYYINNLVYKKDTLCNEQYDILYHSKIKYIFKDFSKLLSLNNEKILEEVINVLSSIYLIYYKNYQVEGQDTIAYYENRKKECNNTGLDNSTNRVYSVNNNLMFNLNMHEEKDLMNLYFDKHFVHKSFLKCKSENNIYKNLQKVILKDEISNLSLYHLKNMNSNNNNHLIRVLYKLFNANIKNDKNSNFNYYIKLLFSDKFQNIQEIILIFKNLHFFNVHYISLFFYIVDCFFQKLKNKIENKEEFILHHTHKTRGKDNSMDDESNGDENVLGGTTRINMVNTSKSNVVNVIKEKGKDKSMNSTYEIICNNIYEEIKSMIFEENINIHVFYPLLSILCKHNNDINEILDFFYKRVDIYMKDNDTKLNVSKNEMIIIFLCLNYVHMNVSQIPNFYNFLTNLLKEISDKYIKNILLFCLSSCCNYTDVSSSHITAILEVHKENLKCILNYDTGNNSSIRLEENITEDYNNKNKLNDDLSYIENTNSNDTHELNNDDNFYFFISLSNLCFYLYKHYNNSKFDHMVKDIYHIIINSLQKKISSVIVSVTNILMYLYIKKIISMYEITSTLKLLITRIGSNHVFNSKYVVYALCTIYRFVSFYYKENFGCITYEQSNSNDGSNIGSSNNTSNNRSNDISNNISGEKHSTSNNCFKSVKGAVGFILNNLQKIIVKYFDELEDKYISLISYCSLIGLKIVGEYISSDYFNNYECCNMVILFINRFIKKDFEIKKCINTTNRILANTSESEDEIENGGVFGDKNAQYNQDRKGEQPEQEQIEKLKPKGILTSDENLFAYNNNNYKLNADIIVNDHDTNLVLLYMFCYKYYEELNDSLIKIENLDKKHMLYHLFSHLLSIENYLKTFLKTCKLLDIDTFSLNRDKEYEDIKLNMSFDNKENTMSYLNFFSDELYDYLNNFLKIMKLINYIKFDVQIKNNIQNLYSYICKFIKIHYIILDVLILKIMENINDNIKSYYKFYKECIKRVQLLYECRISIFNYFTIFSAFNNSYSHIFCIISNYFNTFSTYEKYMFIKNIINIKKIKKEEIKFIFLNILKNAKLFHQDASLWIYAISVLKILLKRIYKIVRNGEGDKEDGKNYYDLLSYIKYSFITVLNETVLTVYRENYYNHSTLYGCGEIVKREEVLPERILQEKMLSEKSGRECNKVKKEEEYNANDRRMLNNSSKNKGEINREDTVPIRYAQTKDNINLYKRTYVDIPLNVMLCISDFLFCLCKIIIKEKLHEEINIDEMIKDFPILIQGYVILKLKEPFKKLNIIKSKMLFHVFKYNFTFKENIQDFYCAEEKCCSNNNKSVLTLKFNYNKLTEYFQNIFLIKECIYLSYIYSHFNEKQKILENLLSMCNVSQLNKDYLYIIISSFVLFSMKSSNSSFFINNVLYNFYVTNDLIDNIGKFLASVEMNISFSIKREEKQSSRIKKANCNSNHEGVRSRIFEYNGNNNINNESKKLEEHSDNGITTTKGMEEKQCVREEDESAKIFFIIEEEFVRTKMRNSFRSKKNKLLKESNLVDEIILKKEFFFFKKLGIYYLIKNNERSTELSKKYNKLLSHFRKSEKQDFFIKHYDIHALNYKDISRYLYNQDIIDDSYYNNNFFNKNIEDNSFVSFEYEIFSKYLTVPLFMKDVFTFFELNLNKNIVTHSFGELFHKNKKSDKKQKEHGKNLYDYDTPMSDSSEDENSMEKLLFDQKQKKKKKTLLYDNTLLNYLKSRSHCLNNYELYIANISFLSEDIRNILFDKNAFNKNCFHKNSYRNDFVNHFHLLRMFFKNLILFFMIFPKSIILNNSEYFFPNNKNHFLFKVINFLSEDFVNKYS